MGTSIHEYDLKCKAEAEALVRTRNWDGAMAQADAYADEGYLKSDLSLSMRAIAIRNYVMAHAPGGAFLGVREGIARFKVPEPGTLLYFP